MGKLFSLYEFIKDIGKNMKKPKLLNKLTIIDILIIICIIGAVGFAIFHMADDNSSNASATSFDMTTKNKMLENYLNLYQDGNKVTSTIVGTDSSTGEKVELNGDVVWLGESEKEKVNILLDDNGKKVLAGFYKDVPNADIYIDQVSLETNGDTYANITDFQIAPKEINSLNDLISEIPKGTDYEISTTLALENFDAMKYQKLLNALNNNKKPCIVLNDEGNALEINRADKTDLEIANHILGDFDGQTSQIQIRIYNSTPNDLRAIESSYNVLSTYKVS